jgi:hypothetical protein
LQPYLQQVTNPKYSFLFIVATIIVITTDSLWLDQSNVVVCIFVCHIGSILPPLYLDHEGVQQTQLLFIYVQCSRFNMMSFLHPCFRSTTYDLTISYLPTITIQHNVPHIVAPHHDMLFTYWGNACLFVLFVPSL